MIRPSAAPLAIIQARMGSVRLPGKILAPVAGRPLLALLAERLRGCKRIGGIVIATSADPADDETAALAGRLGIACWRGPLADVAGRFAATVRGTGADAFVRVNADSPLLDPRLVDIAVALYAAGDWDLVTNVERRSYPKGQSVEVIRAATFLTAEAEMTMAEDREHVTRFFYRAPDRFRIVNFSSGRPLAGRQLSVDTPEDLVMVSAVAAALGDRVTEAGLDDCLEVLDQAERGERE